MLSYAHCGAAAWATMSTSSAASLCCQPASITGSARKHLARLSRRCLAITAAAGDCLRIAFGLHPSVTVTGSASEPSCSFLSRISAEGLGWRSVGYFRPGVVGILTGLRVASHLIASIVSSMPETSCHGGSCLQ